VSNLKFSFVGTYAQDLADGKIVAPGDEVTLSAKDAENPHNARLIADGLLIGKGEKAQELAEKTREDDGS
jgi:plastocyanin